ncbi:hypothetical protein ICHIJ1_14610 [Fluviibacter phosphoraccumulans]|uniref:hypothetical protein n=1 Tax=Fluviibacter phosphoraccumulans TaxID=1751046 RepID=UPI00136743C8|nr:hypothetical protein [Fluviibacter phosphoraccumulans]BBU71542.1 hypothetical protein ICHIJ1_14610 [Fluviibacter phosphoraccumulans]
MLLAAYLQQNPITEEEVRADYNRQLKQLGQTGNSMQYKISVIVVSSEYEAKEIIKRLNRGDSFAALAKMVKPCVGQPTGRLCQPAMDTAQHTARTAVC